MPSLLFAIIIIFKEHLMNIPKILNILILEIVSISKLLPAD